jgi:hypothetical protein
VGTTIGSGIFRVPAVVAAQLHEPGPVILAWVLGGGITLLGALTIAELAGALPRSGGIFTFIFEGFGPLPAFLFGWSEMVVIRAAALGGIATIFAEYIGYFVPLSAAQVHHLAAAAIALVGIVNYLGVRRAAVVMNLMTFVKFAALGVLGLLAFTAGKGSIEHFRSASNGGLDLSLLATALIPILWTYDGWSNLSFVGGEVKDPQRTLPMALILGTVAIISIYLLTNAAFIYLVALRDGEGPIDRGERCGADSAFRGIRLRDHCSGGGGSHLWQPEWLDDDRSASRIRNGGTRTVLSRNRTHLSAIPNAVDRNRAGNRIRRCLRTAERLRAPGRQIYPRQLAILRARRCGGVHATP